jgi:hypothetical protein
MRVIRNKMERLSSRKLMNYKGLISRRNCKEEIELKRIMRSTKGQISSKMKRKEAYRRKNRKKKTKEIDREEKKNGIGEQNMMEE